MEVKKHIPTSSAAPAKSEFTVNDLDDDSLGIIFNKLPCIDRIRIESVCKRWRRISEAYLCCYSRRLIIDRNMGCFPCQQVNSNEKSANILEEILQQRGPYLEEIDFTQCRTWIFNTGTIKWMTGLCPKLKRLHLSTLYLDFKDWFAISSDLEALSFIFFADMTGAKLRHLLHRTKRLRRIQIESHYFLEPSAFDHLDPGQLEFLQVTQCRLFALTDELADKLAESLVELNYEPLSKDTCYLRNLYKLKNLRFLNLQAECAPFEATMLADIADNCRKLEGLTLAFPRDYPCNKTIIAPLFRLPYLRRLVVSVAKKEMQREELDMLFLKALKLKLFVLTPCIYKNIGTFEPCRNHSRAPYFFVCTRR